MNLFLKIGLLITGILILFVMLLFYSIMPKRKEVTDQEPFKTIIKEKLNTTETTYLYQQVKYRSTFSAFILFQEKQADSQLTFIEELPQGVNLKINKIIVLTNGISGIQHCICDVSLKSEKLNKMIQAEYYWGQHHAICLEEPCNYWTFGKAVWQIQADCSKHFLK